MSEWMDWLRLERTKLFVNNLDILKLNMLSSIMTTEAGSDRDEAVGRVQGIEFVLNLINDMRTESNE